MRRTPFFLLTLLAVQLIAEEANDSTEEVAANPLAMQRLGWVPGSPTKKERIAKLESEMDEVFTGVVRGDFGAKAAPARPDIDSYRLYVKGDLLFWKEYIGGSDYAFTDQDMSSNVKGTNKHLTFDWGWGARGELGYHFPHDSMDALVRYTWFQARAANRMTFGPGGAVQPLYTEFEYAQPSLAKAHWKTKLSVLDAEFGKDFFVNRWLACKPFFGLKTAWIDQSMTTRYNQFPNSFMSTLVKAKNDFWGIGPWGGINSTARFTKWANLFCSFGGSLMVGDFDVVSKVVQGLTVNPIINLKENVTRIVPMMQASLGFGWDIYFNRNRNHIAIRTAYEVLYWWRQNQLTHYGSNIDSSTRVVQPPLGRYAEDLGFQGCTLDLLFDF